MHQGSPASSRNYEDDVCILCTSVSRLSGAVMKGFSNHMECITDTPRGHKLIFITALSEKLQKKLGVVSYVHIKLRSGALTNHIVKA